MTKSEELTSLISKKYFLHQYIYTDVYVKEGLQEFEFCDCLVEFSSCYIVIQIKERNPGAQGSAKKWFRKKVLDLAKRQIRDTFAYYGNSSNTITSKTSELTIDRTKTLIPVIVFLNSELDKYDRIAYSNSLDVHINIFSYDDFNTMLDTIMIPYDILNYLSYRTVFGNTQNGRIVFDDINDDATLLSRPNTEQDYAYLFLIRSYYKALAEQDITEENIAVYNDVISRLNEATGYSRDIFIEGLLCVDYLRADRITRNWCKLMELAKAEQYVDPYHVTLGNRAYLFLVHPNTMPDDDFNFRLECSMIYRKYKDHVTLAHVIALRHIGSDQYQIELCDIDLESNIRYEELVDKVVSAYENID